MTEVIYRTGAWINQVMCCILVVEKRIAAETWQQWRKVTEMTACKLPLPWRVYVYTLLGKCDEGFNMSDTWDGVWKAHILFRSTSVAGVLQACLWDSRQEMAPGHCYGGMLSNVIQSAGAWGNKPAVLTDERNALTWGGPIVWRTLQTEYKVSPWIAYPINS